LVVVLAVLALLPMQMAVLVVHWRSPLVLVVLVPLHKLLVLVATLCLRLAQLVLQTVALLELLARL
jgi:hypothetical protein